MKSRLQERGFSLVEILCAILILGVGIVGLTQGLTTALSSSKESEVQTGAALLAASRIELLRADGYVVDGFEKGDEDEGASLYRWEQTISGTDLAGLHQVKVVVQNASTGQPIYELQTLLFDPPLDTTSSDSERNSRRGKDRRADRRRR